MHVHEAVNRIAHMDAIFQRAAFFRGYRSQLILFSAFTGIAGAMLQPLAIGNAIENSVAYVDFWSIIAVFNIALAGSVLWLRAHQDVTGREKRLTLSAASAILPSLVTGAMLNLVFVSSLPEAIPLLPGLWAILFGLGVCASRMVLPAAIMWSGIYFIGAGIYALTLREQALNPWTMLNIFGIGQTLSACLLYWSLERPRLLEHGHE